MLPGLISVIAVAAAYFLGAIPFAYVLVRWRKGIDIRTVGSGNVGATNAGRVLGFPYFLLVFALDVAKGFLPTWGLPRLAEMIVGTRLPWLAVPVGLATILGHNFPIYLSFRGGKGVATSLGALIALDPVACLGAAATFGVVLVVTRFVSMSSVLGGCGFAAVHFATVERPWSREQVGMTLLTILLLALLTIRHRKNFVRIAAGTEPKVPLRPRRKEAKNEAQHESDR